MFLVINFGSLSDTDSQLTFLFRKKGEDYYYDYAVTTYT